MADTSCGGLLAGHAGMTVYGPPGLNTLVNAFRTFVNVKDIGLQVRACMRRGRRRPCGCCSAMLIGTTGCHPEQAPQLPCRPAQPSPPDPAPQTPVCLQVNEFGAAPATEPLVKTELVAITPVTLTATPPSSAAADGGDGTEPEAKRQRVEGGSGGGEQQAAASSMDIASVAVEGPAACYVCELPDVPGKFLPQKVRCQTAGGGCCWGWVLRAGRGLLLWDPDCGARTLAENALPGLFVSHHRFLPNPPSRTGRVAGRAPRPAVRPPGARRDSDGSQWPGGAARGCDGARHSRWVQGCSSGHAVCASMV